MIQFTEVYKRYPNRYEALSGLSFHLQQGEMAFLTGHSGAGKSTLLKLIALIERSSSGQVLVNNQNLSRLPQRKIPHYRRQIGLVFQDHNLLHDRTVFDNVALPLVIAGENHHPLPGFADVLQYPQILWALLCKSSINRSLVHHA